MNVIKSDGSDESAAIFGTFELDPACTPYRAVFDGFEASPLERMSPSVGDFGIPAPASTRGCAPTFSTLDTIIISYPNEEELRCEVEVTHSITQKQ